MMTQAELLEAHDLAIEFCGECRDYHLTRPLLVASGVRRGPERDRETFAPLLDTLVVPGDSVLIAGAADAGLLAFLHDVAGDRRLAITIIDQCRTPLTLCERYADSRGLSVRTVQGDLLKGPPVGRFDVIIAHAIIQFIPDPERLSFLTALAQMLKPGGKLILAFGLSKQRGPSRSGQFERVISGLARSGLIIPSPAGELLEALERFFAVVNDPFDDELAVADDLYSRANLRIVVRRDALRSGPEPGGDAPPGRRYLVAEHFD